MQEVGAQLPALRQPGQHGPQRAGPAVFRAGYVCQRRIAKRRGSFYTTGFQEEYNARKNNLFTDDEYRKQAGIVLEERLNLYNYAVDDYSDGLLFFYFSSSDLQSHMFWWDWNPVEPTNHPSRHNV